MQTEADNSTIREEHERMLEKLFNKNQLLPRIRKEFEECKDFDFRKYMLSKTIDPDFGFNLMVQMALHKRTTLPTLVGILRNHFNSDTQATADALLVAAEADLVDWEPNFQMFVVKFNVAQHVQEELDRYQFPLPMIVEPRELRTNRSSPYLELKDGSVILRDNHHNDDVCLDHLNKMNKIKFCLNNQTAVMIQNQWRNLDKQKEGETKQDFEKRKRAFAKYDRTAKDVMAQVTKLGNEFFLTHKYDKRGRIYAQGYHINYQGTAWNKAVIEFVNKELVE